MAQVTPLPCWMDGGLSVLLLAPAGPATGSPTQGWAVESWGRASSALPGGVGGSRVHVCVQCVLQLPTSGVGPLGCLQEAMERFGKALPALLDAEGTGEQAAALPKLEVGGGPKGVGLDPLPGGVGAGGRVGGRNKAGEAAAAGWCHGSATLSPPPLLQALHAQLQALCLDHFREVEEQVMPLMRAAIGPGEASKNVNAGILRRESPAGVQLLPVPLAGRVHPAPGRPAPGPQPQGGAGSPGGP